MYSVFVVSLCVLSEDNKVYHLFLQRQQNLNNMVNRKYHFPPKIFDHMKLIRIMIYCPSNTQVLSQYGNRENKITSPKRLTNDAGGGLCHAV